MCTEFKLTPSPPQASVRQAPVHVPLCASKSMQRGQDCSRTGLHRLHGAPPTHHPTGATLSALLQQFHWDVESQFMDRTWVVGGWGGVGVSSSCRFTKNKHLFRKCRNAVRQRKLLLVSQRKVFVGGCLRTHSSPLSQASVPQRSPDPEP